MSYKKIITALSLFGYACASNAGEGSFGWIYTLDLQPRGTYEFEQKIDLTTKQAAGKYKLWKSKTGIEYGVSNDFQITGYLNSYSIHANQNYVNGCDGTTTCTSGWGVKSSAANSAFNRTLVDGASIESIWRITNPVLNPVGVGIYTEITKGTLVDSFEARLLLQSNFMDDRLVLAANIVTEMEKYKFSGDEITQESMIDLLYGATYRFAPKWFAGIEGRFHNDYLGYRFASHTQKANFIGPNIHYAEKDWWITAAWRYQIGGQCYGDGAGECSGGKVWDSHGKNQFIVKFGAPF